MNCARCGWAQEPGSAGGGGGGLAGAQGFHRELMQAHPGLLTVRPAERPSSSPRPDIGEVHADRVLLVWKPVESYGPVTYIVQCSLEGVGPSRTHCSWGRCGAAPGGGVGPS